VRSAGVWWEKKEEKDEREVLVFAVNVVLSPSRDWQYLLLMREYLTTSHFPLPSPTSCDCGYPGCQGGVQMFINFIIQFFRCHRPCHSEWLFIHTE
jgi:hypothetical protein